MTKSVINKIYDEYVIGSLNYPITKNYINNRIKQLRLYQERLEKLKLRGDIPQKTPEWYRIRENMITASNFAVASGLVNKTITIKDFIKKKCKHEIIIESEQSLTIMRSGVKYEDVAIKLYELYHDTEVIQFGLIKHPDDGRFGASPDGVNKRGIAVEIKCPYKREIDGSMKEEYYYQVQGQLEICDLEECDFIEYDFRSYETKEGFYKDFDETNIFTNNMKDKGIIIEKSGKFYYSKLRNTKDELLQWEQNTIDELDKETDKSEIITWYWYLNRHNCIRLYRDRLFWNKIYKAMTFIYDKIEYYKKNVEDYNNDIKPRNISNELLEHKHKNIAELTVNFCGESDTTFDYTDNQKILYMKKFFEKLDEDTNELKDNMKYMKDNPYKKNTYCQRQYEFELR
jgi:putative phage-type endonuclease